MSVPSQLYYRVRVLVHKSRDLLRVVQMLRGWLILGPIRGCMVWFYQKRKPTASLLVNRYDLFPKKDVRPVVDSLKQKGYAYGWKIPEIFVNRIVEYAEETKYLRYWNPHRECEAIDQIARNEKLVEVARQYIGAEPILWLTQLKWSFGPDSAEERKNLLCSDNEPILYDEGAFHYDALDFKSLTIFIYLTDVDPSCGPHVLIEKTHRNKSFGEIFEIILSDESVQEKFGADRIKMILGPKGTMLFEETSSFHKASRCQTKRLMLSIDYVLQRQPPPERPVLAG